VVTICTAQWSLYVPHSGQYMYRTVVTICTAQWSLYVPHSGQYMYRTVSTFTNIVPSAHTVCLCVVWISEQTAIISLYNINWLVCITETECVYSAVRTESLCIVQINLCILSRMFLSTGNSGRNFPWACSVCYSYRHTLALTFWVCRKASVSSYKLPIFLVRF
jgi:hypothetical protein